jgi:hypothetical protein
VLHKAKREAFLAMLNDFLRGHGAVIEPADVMSGKPFGSRFDAMLGAPAAKRRGRKRG